MHKLNPKNSVVPVLLGWALFLVFSFSLGVNSYQVGGNRLLSYNYVDLSDEGKLMVEEEDGHRYVYVRGVKEELTDENIYIVPMGMKVGYLDGRLVMPVDWGMLAINTVPFLVVCIALYILMSVRGMRVRWFVAWVLVSLYVVSSVELGYFVGDTYLMLIMFVLIMIFVAQVLKIKVGRSSSNSR